MRTIPFLIAGAVLLATSAGIGGPAGEAGFVPIFNGKDLTGWKLRRNGPNGWSVQDGVLINRPPSVDLVSEKHYLDFELKYEYRQYGNSGVGLRGRYEIAIDDSFGKPPTRTSDGALYGQVAPAQNVGKARGEWQTIHAIVRGDRLTVIHNGVKTLDNVPLTRPTGIQYGDRYENEAGPIILQGDHGPVDFRNLRIKELPRG